MSVAQLVASVSGVVLGGVAEVVGSNLARGKYLQHLSAQLIHYIPPYIYSFYQPDRKGLKRYCIMKYLIIDSSYISWLYPFDWGGMTLKAIFL